MTFETIEEQLEAIANLKPALEYVELNNEKFQQGLSNFESAVYPFNLLSRDSFRSQFLGLDPPEEEEKIILPLVSVDGQITASVARRKRATSTSVGPECMNLPVSKNWAQEGKTAPVQNQGGCGKTKK